MMNRLFRSNSSTSLYSRSSSLPKIPQENGTINSEEYELSDLDLKLGDWNIPKVSTNEIYRSSWNLKKAFKKDYHVRTIEQVCGLRKPYETRYLFSSEKIKAHRKQGHKFLHIGLVQVGVKPLIREGLNSSILLTLRDICHIRFNDSLLRTIETSLSGGPVHSNCFPNFTVDLHGEHIMKDDNNSQKIESPSGTDMEDPYQDFDLKVLKRDFEPDMDALGKEFDLEKNRVKREAYRANYTREQKVEVLNSWKAFMKEISDNIPFFEYFENHFD
ncbi:hypothetical protein SO802_015881 [Lithocarpus litseifolius]|uniref:DUF7588 domain-containing protein n=1 Tax=Lithocarpus litseifolius TaxID=425828 RepID=A0AAW2CUY0_9ROSI